MDKRRLFIPGAVFFIFAWLYVGLSLLESNDFLFRPVWDIDHYRTIAEEGYIARPCDPGRDYPMGEVCGNVGWFPLWPLTARILSLGHARSGLKILPFLFTFLGLILFYNVVLRLTDRVKAVAATIALVATPTAFYFLTGFPYALILFLFSAYLYYLYNDKARFRTYIIPVLGILISLTYPSAVLVAVIPLVFLIDSYRRKLLNPGIPRIISDLLYYLLPFALGPLLLSLYFHIKFDDFLLMLHFQEKYDRHWGFPLTIIWNSLKDFRLASDAHFMDQIHTNYLANFVILWYGLIFIIFFSRRIKPELFIYSLVLYLFSPATGAVISIWRHYLLLFPAAMIIAASPRPAWLKCTCVGLGLLLALIVYFPKFMHGFLI